MGRLRFLGIALGVMFHTMEYVLLPTIDTLVPDVLIRAHSQFVLTRTRIPPRSPIVPSP